MPYIREQLLQVQAGNRVRQARADDAFAPWGMRAPEPVIGEDPDHYRRKLLIQAKNQLPEKHELRGVKVNRLYDDALGPYEDLIYSACKAAATRPDSVPLGEMRRVEKVDGNGLKTVEWVGQRSFVHDFTIPGRRVLGRGGRLLRSPIRKRTLACPRTVSGQVAGVADTLSIGFQKLHAE